MSERYFQAQTTYFFEEGKSNLPDCIRLAFAAALQHDIQKLVIFTGAGQGVRMALDSIEEDPGLSSMQVVGVSFPSGKVKDCITTQDAADLVARGASFLKAHLPFDPIKGTFQERGVGQGLALLGSALETFCGSMSLCVQSVLMACDAGLIETGEHVIALTSDTAILVRACPTDRFLTEFIIREILCKPVLLTISKKEDPVLETSNTGDDLGPKILPPE